MVRKKLQMEHPSGVRRKSRDRGKIGSGETYRSTRRKAMVDTIEVANKPRMRGSVQAYSAPSDLIDDVLSDRASRNDPTDPTSVSDPR